MTGEHGLGRGSARAPLTAYPWRRSRESTRVSVLALSLGIVFMLSIAHDEIVAHLVASGWLAEGRAELAEIALGLLLFVVWGGLTVTLVDTLRRAPASRGAQGATTAGQDGPQERLR